MARMTDKDEAAKRAKLVRKFSNKPKTAKQAGVPLQTIYSLQRRGELVPSGETVKPTKRGKPTRGRPAILWTVPSE